MTTVYNKATGKTELIFTDKHLVDLIRETMGDDIADKVQGACDCIADLETELAMDEQEFYKLTNEIDGLKEEYKKLQNKQYELFTLEEVNEQVLKEHERVSTEWKNKYKALEESRTIRVIKKTA